MMDLTELSDPGLKYDRNREQVNDLVMNVVIKYLAKYLNVRSRTIKGVRGQLKALIDESREDNKTHNPMLTGQYVENIYGYRPGVDYFPLSCHGDIRKTAALFKEIAFSDAFLQGNPKRYTGLDLGSGTGILTLAALMMGRRLGIENVLCIGIEQRGLSVSRSRQALKKLSCKEVNIVQTDLMKEGLLERLMRSPTAWVSETILGHTEHSTPRLDLEREDLGLTDIERRKQLNQRKSDPFVLLLQKTIELMPEFAEKVRAGKIVMFPDVFNGLYRPNKHNSTLRLRTGTDEPLKLHEIGKEFEEYEELGLGVERWREEKREASGNAKIMRYPKRRSSDSNIPEEDDQQLSLFED